MIGLHLMVDGIIKGKVDEGEIARVLRELPAEIGMRILWGPLIVKGGPENPGWTGFVIIEKSHISIHTFEVGGLISIDIYSCRPFDEGAVLRYLESRLPLERLSSRTVVRDIEG
jgi:S-adenosylmethionine decarboxylase